ncbi:hypothetical protein [Anaerotignum sp.]
MRMIEIVALDNGAHRNQFGDIGAVPEGWAVIPEGMEIPNTFPFVDIEAEDGTVVAMTAGTMPEVEPVEEEPSQMDVLEAQVMYTAMMTDTLIEG